MSVRGVLNIGPAIEQAAIAAMYDWREKHARGIRIDDLLANDVTSLTVEATLWRGGRMTVITFVRGRRQYDDETHVTRLNYTPQTSWKRTGSTLPSI